MISTNSIADVDPALDPALNPRAPDRAAWSAVEGQRGVIEDWNGGAFASRLGSHGSLLVFGGGHKGYYGSEVYAFDLGTQRWRRVTNPYPGPFNWPFPSASYPDGSPIPPHTYDYVDYHEPSNSFVLFRGITDGYQGTNTTSHGITHMLDLGTGRWRRSQRNGPEGLSSGGTSCYDRNRDVFWIQSPHNNRLFSKFEPRIANPDGTFGRYSNFPIEPVGIDAAADCDPVRDLYVFTEFRNDDRVYARSLGDPGAPRIVLQETGSPPPKEHQNGWVWSDKRQGFVYWRRGAGVFEFRNEGTAVTGPWRWTNLTVAANQVVPVDMERDNGVYSRFRIARFGNEEVALVVNRVNGPVYAFRIPGSSVASTTPEAVVTLSAGRTSILSTETTTLTWTATNAASCTASGGWSGNKPTSGSQSVGPLATSTTFTLACANSAGSVRQASVQIVVSTPGSSGGSGTSPTSTTPNAGISSTTSGGSDGTTTGGSPGTVATFNAESDWLVRSGGTGVFYANNFSRYASDAEIDAAGENGARPPRTLGSYHVYTGSGGPPVLSGGKALEIRTHDLAGQNGGTWKLNEWGPRRNGFFFQFHVAYNRAALAWRAAGTPGELKTVFIGGNGNGQVLVWNPNYQGFPALFFDGAGGGGLERVVSGSGGYPGDRYRQTAIDAGSPDPVLSLTAGIQRYGPSRRISGGSPALYDYSYKTGNAASNFLDNRGFAFPDADAVRSGAVPYLIDDWLVIEVYYEQADNDPERDYVYMWAAPRGQRPRRVSGTWPLTGAGTLNRPKIGRGANPGGIELVQLTNYDTPRLAEPGYRPLIKTWFGEVVGSTRWIPFPGYPTEGAPGGGPSPPLAVAPSSPPPAPAPTGSGGGSTSPTGGSGTTGGSSSSPTPTPTPAPPPPDTSTPPSGSSTPGTSPTAVPSPPPDAAPAPDEPAAAPTLLGGTSGGYEALLAALAALAWRRRSPHPRPRRAAIRWFTGRGRRWSVGGTLEQSH